jgi:hypothetical protein
VERVVERSSANVAWPMLTRTNYPEWALVMEVNYQTLRVWDVVDIGIDEDPDEDEYQQDRQAMACLLRSVPSDMWGTLGRKRTVKEAWDAVKVLRVGGSRARDASAQQLRREFGALVFKDGESVSEFGIRITSLAVNLRILGDNISNAEVVKKLLHVVPDRLSQSAVSLEMFLDLNTASIEDVVGRLRVFEERGKPKEITDGMGRLLLCEEEWEARRQIRREQEISGGGGSSSSRGKDQGRGRGRGRGGAGPSSRDGQSSRSVGGAYAGAGRPPPGTLCNSCGKKGHWARDCKGKKKKATAHVVQAEEEEDRALMFVSVETEEVASRATLPYPSALLPLLCAVEPQARVHLVEPKVLLHLSEEEKEAEGPCRWVLDTGATNHMTGSRHVFSELDSGVSGTVKFGDGSVVNIEGKGTVLFALRSGEHRRLGDVYFIPRLTTNIVSLGQMDENGFKVVIEEGILRIFDPSRLLLAKVHRTPSRLYYLDMKVVAPVCLTTRVGNVAWRWHERFGHLNFRSLRKLSRGEMVKGLPEIDQIEQVCEDCVLAKQKRSPFPQAAKFRAKDQLELVHGDLCGPITPPTPVGNAYFLLLVDDMSRDMWLTLLRSKSDAPAAIMSFQVKVERETNKKLKVLRTDNGGEFTSVQFGEYCAGEGILRQHSAPHSPQQNGVVERRNQMVVNTARSILRAQSMPDFFWGEAVHTAVYLLNRSPTAALDDLTPFQAWYGKKPPVHFLRVFGCVAFIKHLRPHPTKLEDRGRKVVFIGYEAGAKAYRFYDHGTERVRVAHDVVFDENARWDWGSATSSDSSVPFTVEEEYELRHQAPTPSAPGSPSHAASPTPLLSGAPSRSGGATPAASGAGSPVLGSTRRQEPSPTIAAPNAARVTQVEFATPLCADLNFDADDDEDMKHWYMTLENVLGTNTVPWRAHCDVEEAELHNVSVEEPKSFKDADGNPNWNAAMEEELKSIRDNDTWSLADLPRGQQAIGLKWLYKVMRNENDVVVKYKALLVAKGYVQRPALILKRCSPPSRGWNQSGCYLPLLHTSAGEFTTWTSNRHS